MTYPKILAFYRFEKGGMIYDYLNAKTKKEAKETIRANGATVYAVLTMEEAYKLAYCTTEFTTKGFHGVLNTKNRHKVMDVKCFLTDCFFYENLDMVTAYEKESKIDEKIARYEVEIAHYMAQVKMWKRLGGSDDFMKVDEDAIVKLQTKIAERKAQLEQVEQQKNALQAALKKESQKIEDMLVANGVEIVDKYTHTFKNDTEGVVEITVKNPHGGTEKITKYTGLNFYSTTIDATIKDEQIVSFYELEKLIEDELVTTAQQEEQPHAKNENCMNDKSSIMVAIANKENNNDIEISYGNYTSRVPTGRTNT